MTDVLLSLKIEASGEPKSIDMFLPASTTLAQAQGYLTGIAPLIDAIAGGVILGSEVTLPMTLPGGLKTSQVTGATVHRGGLFGFDNASPYKWSEYVPSLLIGLFNGKDVNVGDTDVNAFITAIEDGITVSSVAIHQTNQYADVLTTNLTAKQSFRK